MTERPILFSAPMVRALLAGTKTQTRRAVKRVGNDDGFVLQDYGDGWWPYRSADGESAFYIDSKGYDHEAPHRCPYGKPGDQLWVREAWAPGDLMVFDADKDDPETILYRADKAAMHWDGEAMRTPMDTYAFNWESVRWKPSIHMPRWASRITLEVTGVRVERLQDISGPDAIAEGLRAIPWDEGCCYAWREGDNEGHGGAVECYRDLWETINGAGSWAANPWVWVVEFKRAD